VIYSSIDSDFLRFLLIKAAEPGGCDAGARLPSLDDISAQTGISIGKLREQLEVARALGLVEVSPRRGIRCRAFEFLPAVRLSLMVALSLDRRMFKAYSQLRVHLEDAFWDEAVALLTEADRANLQELVARAWAKLNLERIQIPHAEHRQFHLTIYSRLANPFVQGLLEAYWDAYEAVELNTYADLGYLQTVWTYHERIVAAICSGEFEAGKVLLAEHHHLLDEMGNSHEAPVTEAFEVPGTLEGVAGANGGQSRSSVNGLFS
jgi:DNA-binding FadR family transcriptional regulator